VERYPRLQRVQRMLSVINRALTQAEQEGEPGIRVFVVGGEPDVGVKVLLTGQHIKLAEELGLSGGETVGLFRWAESEGFLRPNYGRNGRNSEAPLGVLEHLESEGYELIGELPNPQERLALILDAAIQAVQRDQSLTPDERKRRIDLFEGAKFVVRTLGVEVAKAVWRGDLPPM
jgi:hypothetical protein